LGLEYQSSGHLLLLPSSGPSQPLGSSYVIGKRRWGGGGGSSSSLLARSVGYQNQANGAPSALIDIWSGSQTSQPRVRSGYGSMGVKGVGVCSGIWRDPLVMANEMSISSPGPRR